MNIILKDIRASASIGPNQHGIILYIEGMSQNNRHFGYSDKLSIDIQGPVFSYLPSGLGTLAKLFLPYKIERFQQDQVQWNAVQKFSIELGYNQVSQKTLMKTLDDVIRAGDPYFYIELILNSQNTLCVFPTKCSLLKRSLENQKQDIVYRQDDIPKFKLKSNAFGYFRWLLFATLYMFAIWATVFKFKEVDQFINIHYFSKQTNNSLSFMDYLPPFPKNKTEAYLFGVYNEQYLQMESQKNISGMEKILKNASILAQRKSLTGEELKGVQQTIWELESKKGLVQRVLGFFTFVNILWIVSILGSFIFNNFNFLLVSLTVGPFLYYILKPLRQYFQAFMMQLFKKVILPTIEFLHNIGFFELIAYVICLFFILEGFRVNPEYGFYISFTGIALQIPAFFYSSLIHKKKVRSEKNEENLYKLLNYWALACWIPITIYTNSSLLGYITLISFYTLMGFSFNCFGLCYYIGFKNDESLIQIIICSFFGLTIYTILKIANFPEQYLSPYASAVSVLGSFTMFLGLLISSSKWHDRYHYGFGQGLMICALICSIFFGYIFGIEGMKNTAIVFLILFILEKYTERHFDSNWNPWIYFFFLSILLWRAALYLHTHPYYIISMFQVFK